MNRSDCFAKADAALKEKIAKNRDEEKRRLLIKNHASPKTVE